MSVSLRLLVSDSGCVEDILSPLPYGEIRSELDVLSKSLFGADVGGLPGATGALSFLGLLTFRPSFEDTFGFFFALCSYISCEDEALDVFVLDGLICD